MTKLSAALAFGVALAVAPSIAAADGGEPQATAPPAAASLAAASPDHVPRADAAEESGPSIRRAWVHIVAPTKVMLHRRPAGTDTFVVACESPCDEEMPLDDAYRIAGPGLKTSEELRIHARSGSRVELTVTTRSKARATVGWVLVGVGGAAVLLGAGLGLFDTVLTGALGASKTNGATPVVVGLLGGGALVDGVGAVTIATNTAGVSVTREKRRVRDEDAFVRAPAWRSLSAIDTPARAAFPVLLQGRF